MMKRLIVILASFVLMSFVIAQKPADYDDLLNGMYNNTVEFITVEDLTN